MLREYLVAVRNKEKAEEDKRNHLKTLESPEMMKNQELVYQMKLLLRQIEMELGEILFFMYLLSCPAGVLDCKAGPFPARCGLGAFIL